MMFKILDKIVKPWTSLTVDTNKGMLEVLELRGLNAIIARLPFIEVRATNPQTLPSNVVLADYECMDAWLARYWDTRYPPDYKRLIFSEVN